MESLTKEFKPQASAIDQAFNIIDQCIELHDSKARADNYHKICGLTLAKARNYALGAYGLMLDGLGQEAGALIRPFIEYYELLVYFRTDHNRVNEAINDKLPSAGKRAKIIKGDFQDFREYLNDNASHSSYSNYSLSHLLDKKEMKIRKEQPFFAEVLFRNMSDLFIQLILLCIEAINGLKTYESGCAIEQGKSVLALREYGIEVFKLEERVPRGDSNAP